jgi:hypothetical protein
VTEANERDCTIYVEAEQPNDDLARLVAESFDGTVSSGLGTSTVSLPFGEIEIRRNEDADQERAREVPDGFVYFRRTLELYPLTTVGREVRISFVATLLEFLWSRGWPAVAACDYEKELPKSGGYGGGSIP